ncbi:GtrA family protein [Lapillicoccus jejuensis]|uniref:Putative flippase GtrA n=1 Tax=Lapillicoccus jejuensis TaxID=402171 RepID=A0A542DYB5_9MICO|nr:GtrA family protein [Lapillicoccus jejuensis]TQJ08078.1 putative flippase GtrA [Lapillicoccus jejuensis]
MAPAEATRPVPSPAPAGEGRSRARWVKLGRFATIGVASTVLNLGLLALLHRPLGDQVANLVALVVSTLFNTAANRWWTFEVRGREGMGRHQVQGLLVFLLTWGLTSGALKLLDVLVDRPATIAVVAVVALGNVVATVVRYVAMQRWIFKPAP